MYCMRTLYVIGIHQVNKAMPKGDRKRKAAAKAEGQAEKKSKPLVLYE